MGIVIDLQFFESEIKVIQSKLVFFGVWVDLSFEVVFGEFGVVFDGFNMIVDQVVVVNVQSAVFVFLVVQEYCVRVFGF